MADNRNMLAGMQASGVTSTEFMFVAPVDTPIPTDLWDTPLDPAWKGVGNCDPKGLTIKRNKNSTDVKSYGSFDVQRTITTEDKRTFEVTLQETNPTALEVYNGLPLGSVVADEKGMLSVKHGVARTTRYAALFLSFDGDNRIAYAARRMETTGAGDLNLAMGQVLDRPITCTVYTDADGVSLQEFYVVGKSTAAPVSP